MDAIFYDPELPLNIHTHSCYFSAGEMASIESLTIPIDKYFADIPHEEKHFIRRVEYRLDTTHHISGALNLEEYTYTPEHRFVAKLFKVAQGCILSSMDDTPLRRKNLLGLYGTPRVFKPGKKSGMGIVFWIGRGKQLCERALVVTAGVEADDPELRKLYSASRLEPANRTHALLCGRHLPCRQPILSGFLRSSWPRSIPPKGEFLAVMEEQNL